MQVDEAPRARVSGAPLALASFAPVLGSGQETDEEGGEAPRENRQPAQLFAAADWHTGAARVRGGYPRAEVQRKGTEADGGSQVQPRRGRHRREGGRRRRRRVERRGSREGDSRRRRRRVLPRRRRQEEDDGRRVQSPRG